MAQDLGDNGINNKNFPQISGGLVLFLLVIVYTLNFLDRQILAILAPAIQKELGLSDTQIGLMRGVSFAIFYSILGVPIAFMADRVNRTNLITLSLTIWSGMTAVCGVAVNFWQLFFARMFVGVGEAGGVAPAYSIISDYFEPKKRARAISIYSMGIPIGSAIGLIFGAVIATVLNWRTAFIITGIIGIIFAPIFRILMKEPQRGANDRKGAKTEPAKVKEVITTLAAKPSFWTLSLGAAAASMMGYGIVAWLPAFFVRSYGENLVSAMSWLPSFLIPQGAGVLLYAGYFYGIMYFIGGMLGMYLGGVISDKLGAKSKGAYAAVPAVSFLLSLPFFVLGTVTNNVGLAFFVYLVPTALGLVWLGPVTSAVQNIVPPNMRSTAAALFLFVNSLVGIGLGDLLIGVISDSLKVRFAEESLRYSILCGTIFYIIAAALLLISAKLLPRDWEE